MPNSEDRVREEEEMREGEGKRDVWVDNGRHRPHLLAAVPCEDVAASASMGDGRVSFQRVFYDLYAGAFPAGFDRLNVATVWMGGQGEHTLGARLSGPDGAVLAEAEVAHVCQPEPATTVHLVHFSNDRLTLVLPGPGRYTVDLLVDGASVGAFPLFVVGVNDADGGEA